MTSLSFDHEGWRIRLLSAALACSCAHTGASSPRSNATQANLATAGAAPTAPDAAWEEAQTALVQGHFAEAGHLFAAFADAFHEDERRPLARLQQAYAALADPDPRSGTDQAGVIAERLRLEESGGQRAEEISALRAVVEARKRLRSDASDRSAQLDACRRQIKPIADLERDRNAAKASAAKLQLELQKKERALEEVKQRLLEIQQLAAEMLGVPKPAPAAAGPAGLLGPAPALPKPSKPAQ